MNQREWITVACTFAALALSGLIALMARRAMRRQSVALLPPQRIRALRWGPEIAFVAFVILFIGRSLVSGLLTEGSQVEKYKQRLTVSIAMLVVEVPVILFLIRGLPYGALPSWRRFCEHVILGVQAWCVLMPITLGVHVVARYLMRSYVTDAAPEHVFIQLLQKHPDQSLIWLLVSIEAILAAPIREELYFRGILQPLAIRAPWGGITLLTLAAAWPLTHRDRLNWLPWWIPMAFVGCVAIGMYAVQLFDSPPRVGFAKRLFPRLQLSPDSVRGGLVGVAVLFGMVHPSWPDPVPLTVLGLGLGWLAIRTQSLTAPIVCHSLFNAMAMMQQFIMTRPTG